ncbi:MAG TPA: hypothetical protein VG165_05935 [Solirubrobacteraceae bacterium]|nr:hypothetical protein [Solirubrobacteraceae bacterium]
MLATAPAAAFADTTVVGSSGQSSGQAIQSSQGGKNAVSAPNQTILGASHNGFVQSSGNTAVNAQGLAVGTSGNAALIAAPGGPGFTQQSTQGVNSIQVGGRMQLSTNDLANIQIVGDGLFGQTVLIGGVGQTSGQAVDSNQIGATSGTRVQTSANTLVNAQIVSADVIIGSADQVNSQGVNSAQTIPSAKKSTGTDIVGTGLPGVNQPGLTIGTPTGPVTQNSANTTVDAQLIIS